MAILNYLQNGTYTVVDGFMYIKPFQQLSVTLSVYDSADKNFTLMQRDITISRCETMHLSHIDVIAPLENYAPGDMWLTHPTDYVDNNPIPIIGHTLVTVGDDLSLIYTSISPGQLVYDDVGQRFIFITPNEILEADPFTDKDLYDQYFNFQDEVNIVRQLYLFLLNECVNFQDCIAG